MSIPKKHHYLPEFYLKRWANDGKVVQYIRIPKANGKLDYQFYAPGEAGCEENL